MGGPTGPLGLAMAARDAGFIAGWVSGKYGATVTREWVWLRLSRARFPGYTRGYSDGSWASWWKRRLEEDGRFESGGTPPEPIDFVTELHVGFVAIEETAEMLARLAGEKAEAGGPATPAIERVMTRPQPIDRTAAIVVGAT